MTGRDRFLAVILRPFAGSGEMELASRQQLGGILDEAGAGDEVLEVATRRFERLDARAEWLRRFGRLLLGALALALLLVPAIRPLVVYVRDFDSAHPLWWFVYGGSPSVRAMHSRALVRGLSGEQAMLLAGDPEILSEAARAESLWRDHFPDDPAVYHEFLRSWLDRYGELPEGAVEMAESLDPGNGFATMLEAGTILQRAVKGGGRRDPADVMSLRDWTIEEPARLERGLALVCRLAAMPVCDGRRGELNARRTAGFGPAGDLETYLARLVWFSGQPMPEVTQIRHISEAIAAEAARLEQAGDRGALRRLADDWLSLVPKIGNGDGSLIEVLVLQLSIREAGGQLLESCRALALGEQARRIERPVADVRRLWDERERGWETGAFDDEDEVIRMRASLLAGMTVPAIARSCAGEVALDPADFEAGRVADYCGLELSAVLLAGVVLLLLAGIVAIFQRRWGKMAAALGRRLGRLPEASDWVWVVVLGVLVPLAWHALVTRVLPLRARDLSVVRTDLLLPVTQVGASFLLVLVATVQTVRWRVAGRAGMFGLVGRRRLVWLPPVAAALALPAACWPAFTEWDSGEELLWILAPSWGLSAVALLWLLGLVGGALLGRPEHSLSRATVGFAMVPALTLGAVVMALVSPLVARELGCWLGRDEVLGISSKRGGVPKYEYLVTKHLRERMLESFESE